MKKENLGKDVMEVCRKYAAKAKPENFIDSLTALTEAYREQCGLSLTYRTLVEGAGWYWLRLLWVSEHPLAEKARGRSFTGMMPYLSEEFNARKEHYWEDYDVIILDSEVIIAATPGLLEEYDHDEAFKIAYCAGFFPYLQSTREYEVDRDRIMAEIKKK